MSSPEAPLPDDQAVQYAPEQPRDLLPSAERPLAGKTAILTGGSRDIGGAIVRALALQGVTVVFSYEKRKQKANEAINGIMESGGVPAIGLQADISTPEGRESFSDTALDLLGGDPDFLILSTSGGKPDINEEASMHFLDKILPKMKDGGTIIRLNSMPAHFGPSLEDLESMPQLYRDVARVKYYDVHAIRRRMDEMAARNIKFIEITPPVARDTLMPRMFDKWMIAENGRTGREVHDGIANKLGLPEVVVAADVGEKVVQLLSDPETEHGYTELFSDHVSDARTALEKWYGMTEIYVDTLRKVEDDHNQHRIGIGRAIASVKQVTQRYDPKMIDESWIDGDKHVGSVRVTPDHAHEHFSDESGLPKILPPHKQIRMAVETVGIIERSFGRNLEGIRLKGFKSAEFFESVPADDTAELIVIPTQNEDGTYDVEIVKEHNREERIAFIKGLRVRPALESNRNTLLEDQILEGAAQTTSLVGKEYLTDGMPVLMSIGEVNFEDDAVKAGDGIDYTVIAEQSKDIGLVSTVSVYSEGRKVGDVYGMRMTSTPSPLP